MPQKVTRLIVKKDTIRTTFPVTYDGKRLNDAVSHLLMYPFCLMIFGFICTAVGGAIYCWWIVSVGAVACLLGAYEFTKYLFVWEDKDDEEKVEEQLYVELPVRKR